METATIYAIQLASGSTDFACSHHLGTACDELAVNDAILSTGEAASTWDCSWCK